MNQNLIQSARKLRLSGLLVSLEMRLQEATSHQLSAEQFLEVVLQDELNVRAHRRVERRKKAAAFRELKNDIHQHLLQILDVNKLETLDPSQVNTRLTATITEWLLEHSRLVSERASRNSSTMPRPWGAAIFSVTSNGVLVSHSGWPSLRGAGSVRRPVR